MKIAWFSPLPPQKSGISDYSEEIVYNLKDYVEIDLWVNSEIKSDFYKNFEVTNYVKYPALNLSLHRYDAIIYNMGNNARYHTNIYETILEYPGIVILHDYVLHHFFASYWLDYKKDSAGYIEEMRYNYGEEGRRIASELFKGKTKPVWETEDVFNYPLNKRVVENALAIVTHSTYVKNLIKPRPLTLLKKINPPILEKTKHNDMELSINDIDFSKYNFILLSFGHVVPYKKLDIVINIFHKHRRLFQNVLYIIIGEGYYYKKLLKTVKKLQLDNVRFLGYQPSQTVDTYIELADICINLRYPTMGETSRSLCEQLIMGKPAIVVDVGWYSELPDDIVVKINPERLEEILLSRLKDLMKNQHLRKKLAKNAKAYIQKEFSMDAFCKDLIDFIKNVNKNKTITSFIDHISMELSKMGIDEDHKMIDKISCEMEHIF